MPQPATKTYTAYFTWEGKRYSIAIRANKPYAFFKCHRALRRRIPGRISAVVLIRDKNRDSGSSAGMIIAEET